MYSIRCWLYYIRRGVFGQGRKSVNQLLSREGRTALSGTGLWFGVGIDVHGRLPLASLTSPHTDARLEGGPPQAYAEKDQVRARRALESRALPLALVVSTAASKDIAACFGSRAPMPAQSRSS